MQWTKGNGGADSDFSDEKTWNPQGADSIQGTLVSKKTITQDGKPVTVLKVENDEGVWNVWGSRKSLKDLLAEYDEQLIVGRTIGIKTDGKSKLDSGRDFYQYYLGFGDDDDAKGSPEKVEEEVF